MTAELRSLFAVLGRAGESFTLDWVHAERHRLEAEYRAVQAQIEDGEKHLFSVADADRLTLAAQEKAYAEVQELQGKIGDATQRRDALALTIADSASFISSLERKLAALNDASATAEALGDIRFTSCPACHAPIVDQASDDACHLCKTPLDPKRSQNRIVLSLTTPPYR